MSDEAENTETAEVWRVAKGVTLFLDDDKIFFENNIVRPEDFETIAEFRGLLAAGKIVGGNEDDVPEEEKTWDYFTVDEELDEKSANPVSNRALFLNNQRLNEDIAQEIEWRQEADEALEARLSAKMSENQSASDEALSAEKTRAESAENDLLEKINAEVVRADTAETGLKVALEAENTARVDAVNSLFEALSAEKTRAENADNALQGEIDVLNGESFETGSVKCTVSNAMEELRSEFSANLDGRTQKLEEADSELRSDLNAVSEKLVSVYTLKGSKKFAELPSLQEVRRGWVFDISDDFVTTDDFIEGAGISCAAGTNIVAVYADDSKYSKDESTESSESESEESTESESEESEEDDKSTALKWDILGGKWNTAEFYNKDEVDSLLADKASELLAKIQSEAEARIKAVSDEASARIKAISDEVTARKSADTSITNRVSALETANKKTQTVSNESKMLTGKETSGLTISAVYNGTSQGYPTPYGNLITIGGRGGSQLLLGWSGVTNGVANVYYRNRRDNQNTWSPWKQLAFV